MVSIIVLYLVTSTPAQLGLVCAFTLIFSLTLALTTRARRVEIFAATAASVLLMLMSTRYLEHTNSATGLQVYKWSSLVPQMAVMVVVVTEQEGKTWR